MAKIKKTPRRRKITSKEALEKALHEESDLMEAEILVRARLAETGINSVKDVQVKQQAEKAMLYCDVELKVL